MKDNSVRSKIVATGSYLPPRIVTNYNLEQIVNTTNEWIVERTGIKQRHIVSEGVLTSHMAYLAAVQAINNAKFDKDQIDLIIVATTTPDNTFPSTATKVQALLEIKNCAAFDIQAVCAGFVYALSIANNFIKAGQAKNVLVIGADCLSSILDWNDRSTCILFGDGAGAVILSNQESKTSGIIDCKIYSDGSLRDLLYTDGGVALNQRAGVIKMQGSTLTKHAVDKMAKAINDILNENNLTIDDVTLLIPHQANIRILELIGRKINLAENKLLVTLDKHANTSAASIPLALNTVASQLNVGDLILMVAFGGGICWGSCILRW